MSNGAASESKSKLFAPGMGRRMWSRLWPFVAFYALVMPAGMIRGVADDIGFPVRRSFTGIEEALLTMAPTHALQGAWFDGYWLQYASTCVYITWFLVPLTTAAGVLMFRPREYWRFIGFLVIAYWMAIPFFALYPLEAPWAHDPSIHRYVAEFFPEAAAADPNPYAAMPSLHVVLPAAAAFWYGWRSPFGKLVFGYTALIGTVIVYGGDHYVADAVAGFALAFATHRAVRWLGIPVLRREYAPAESLEAPAELPRAA